MQNVVGSEGAGKTTLARELAALFHGDVVEDSLRIEADRVGGVPAPDAFAARASLVAGERTSAATASTSGIVISDDAAVTTVAWMDRLGFDVDWRTRYASDFEEADLWLVCRDDFPFQGAPERDDPEGRRRLAALVDAALARRDRKGRVVHVRGEGGARVDIAAQAVREVLEEKRARIVGLLS